MIKMDYLYFTIEQYVKTLMNKDELDQQNEIILMKMTE